MAHSEGIIAIILLIAFIVILHVLFPTRYIGGSKFKMEVRPNAWIILIALVIVGILLAFVFSK